MRKFSRRAFLEAGAASSVAMVGSTAAALPVVQEPPAARPQGRGQAPAASALEGQQRDLLRAAMDEIIPAGDGMPAASEAGGVEYLEQLARRDARSSKELRETLDAIESSTQTQLKTSFVSLSRPQRVEALTTFEKA